MAESLARGVLWSGAISRLLQSGDDVGGERLGIAARLFINRICDDPLDVSFRHAGLLQSPPELTPVSMPLLPRAGDSPPLVNNPISGSCTLT
jgi:hypothetical protein